MGRTIANDASAPRLPASPLPYISAGLGLEAACLYYQYLFCISMLLQLRCRVERKAERADDQLSMIIPLSVFVRTTFKRLDQDAKALPDL